MHANPFALCASQSFTEYLECASPAGNATAQHVYCDPTCCMHGVRQPMMQNRRRIDNKFSLLTYACVCFTEPSLLRAGTAMTACTCTTMGRTAGCGLTLLALTSRCSLRLHCMQLMKTIIMLLKRKWRAQRTNNQERSSDVQKQVFLVVYILAYIAPPYALCQSIKTALHCPVLAHELLTT